MQMFRSLRTVAQSVEKLAARSSTPVIRAGVLVAPYPGTGSIAHVQLSDPTRGSNLVVRAKVLGGVSVGALPVGTPVTVKIEHGQAQVISLPMAASATAVVEPPSDVPPPTTAGIWEQFLNSTGTPWAQFGGPDGWSALVDSTLSPSNDYLEITGGAGFSASNGWVYNVTTGVATPVLNAVTVLETKFAIPTGQTTRVGLLCSGVGYAYAGWLVFLDPTDGMIYVTDELFHERLSGDVGNGVRLTQIVTITIAEEVWYTLRVLRAGNVFTAYLNGIMQGTLAVNAPGGTRFEDVIGDVDGVNDTFTTYGFWAGSMGLPALQVFKNGLLQNPFADYTWDYATRTIVMTTPPLLGDVIFVVYEAFQGGNTDDGGAMPIQYPGVWVRDGTARFKDIYGWRLALP